MISEMVLCSNSRREIYRGENGANFVYIPLTAEECAVLGITSTVNAAVRIKYIPWDGDHY